MCLVFIHLSSVAAICMPVDVIEFFILCIFCVSNCAKPSILVLLERMEMNRIIADKKHCIEKLCLEYNVKTLYAFGSVCTENFTVKSDVDLLIAFNTMDYGDYADSFFKIADEFEELFHRPVDLITNNSLSNPYFIESVNQTKTLIYEQ